MINLCFPRKSTHWQCANSTQAKTRFTRILKDATRTHHIVLRAANGAKTRGKPSDSSLALISSNRPFLWWKRRVFRRETGYTGRAVNDDVPWGNGQGTLDETSPSPSPSPSLSLATEGIA